MLRNEANAPPDLREKALRLSAAVLELADKAVPGTGYALAQTTLADGRAWRKFQAIAEAQGGLRTPPTAEYKCSVTALQAGCVMAIDNRRLARSAKLAGAPRAASAGIVLHTRLNEQVEKGQPLFTLHAETAGELDYALAYVASQPGIVTLA